MTLQPRKATAAVAVSWCLGACGGAPVVEDVSPSGPVIVLSPGEEERGSWRLDASGAEAIEYQPLPADASVDEQTLGELDDWKAYAEADRLAWDAARPLFVRIREGGRWWYAVLPPDRTGPYAAHASTDRQAAAFAYRQPDVSGRVGFEVEGDPEAYYATLDLVVERRHVDETPLHIWVWAVQDQEEIDRDPTRFKPEKFSKAKAFVSLKLQNVPKQRVQSVTNKPYAKLDTGADAPEYLFLYAVVRVENTRGVEFYDYLTDVDLNRGGKYRGLKIAKPEIMEDCVAPHWARTNSKGPKP